MIRAIVYTSCTGHTKEYAELLAARTGLPAYPLQDAKKVLVAQTEILYLGWLNAGAVTGLAAAEKRFAVKAVCGVGMSGGSSQLADMRARNKLPDGMPVFYLQGGFEMDKLNGIYKLMMKTMRATVGKKLSQKPDRTPEEDDMLDLLMHGRNCVSWDKITEVMFWYEQQA